jgi:hypothetical protein
VEAGAELRLALGLKPARTSILSSSSSSSSSSYSSSLLGEDSSGSPSLAYALWRFSSAWRATIFLQARLFASSCKPAWPPRPLGLGVGRSESPRACHTQFWKVNLMRTMYVPGSEIHVHNDYINDSS